MTQPELLSHAHYSPDCPYLASAPSPGPLFVHMGELRQSVEALKTKLETGRRRADAAEARTAELERLNQEKGKKVEEMEERLRLTRQAVITTKHLVPVLQKLRDAETKLEQRSTKADEAEAKYDALNTRIDELQVKYDTVRKEKKELHDMISELGI
ncbi:hypothetical protein P691DRAFT_780522 [Macrolepiota fuliginosa MF-IS2]|uniref:Tropomyosin n=1 Tax=Macrolepiota fuliginosa MF-IS2 TaxID=1400762 RepID=A0A9P5XMR2_9AGAR|nr:hypothetical protein P691DRAFT_780522 [Macrolepiota fuliginosa MF-IS2]